MDLLPWLTSLWTQSYPPKATFTEANVKDQSGKVFIVTGGTSGIGYELTKTLYKKNAKIYIAGRSKQNAHDAIAEIKRITPKGDGSGQLEFLSVDFSNLATIQPAVQEFTSRETKLHVLWNNAGVGPTKDIQMSAQGISLQLATNCLGSYLFADLLQPILQSTAASSESPGSTRVVWTASMTVDFLAPENGLDVAKLDQRPEDSKVSYVDSKVGNLFLAAELARKETLRTAEDKDKAVNHLTLNPGNLKTGAWKSVGSLSMWFLNNTMLHDAKFGALTMLWTGLSEDITLADNGRYAIPWGRWHTLLRPDIETSIKSKKEGGNGRSAEFLEWCEEKCRPFRG